MRRFRHTVKGIELAELPEFRAVDTRTPAVRDVMATSTDPHEAVLVNEVEFGHGRDRRTGGGEDEKANEHAGVSGYGEKSRSAHGGKFLVGPGPGVPFYRLLQPCEDLSTLPPISDLFRPLYPAPPAPFCHVPRPSVTLSFRPL